MNYQGLTPSQQSSKNYGLYKYISLTAFVKLLDTYLNEMDINKMHVIIKFKEIVENTNFTGYNFDIAGIFLNGSNWTGNCPELNRVIGLTLGEKRGKYLHEHFKDEPFSIYNILPYAMSIGSSDVYYGFTSSPINQKYYVMVNNLINHRSEIVDLGGVFINDKEVEFLSSKKAPK